MTNKRMTFIVAVLALFPGCSNQKKQERPAITFELSQLEEMATQYVGKEIVLKGTIDHVCKHGGARMFLVGNTPGERIRIDAGENMKFDPAWEGNTAYITGILEELKIDSTYLDKWEQEVRAKKGREAASKIHTGEQGHEEAENNIENELQQIADYRTAIYDSGKDYLSFYSVKCLKYQIVEEYDSNKKKDSVN